MLPSLIAEKVQKNNKEISKFLSNALLKYKT
jgi:hypothetical protein